MCGIVYKQSFNAMPVNQAIKQLYKNQRSRGMDGFGFYIPKMNRLAHNQREARILTLLDKPDYQASEILFHHRWPTSTVNTQNACHPFSTHANAKLFKHEYVLVHNGIVTNSYELRGKHNKLGIKYVSEQPNGDFNDSEALLYDLALYLDGKQAKLEARGSIAFIVMSEGRLRFGRNYGSPLVYDLNSRGLTVRSEGKGTSVQTNKLYEFNPKNKSFTITDLDIPSYTPIIYDTPRLSSGNTIGFASNYSTGKAYNSYEGYECYESAPSLNGSASGINYRYGSYDTAMELVESFGNTADAIDYVNEIIDETRTKADALEQRVYSDDLLSNQVYTDYSNLKAELSDWKAVTEVLESVNYND